MHDQLHSFDWSELNPKTAGILFFWNDNIETIDSTEKYFDFFL